MNKKKRKPQVLRLAGDTLHSVTRRDYYFVRLLTVMFQRHASLTEDSVIFRTSLLTDKVMDKLAADDPGVTAEPVI